MTEPTLRQLAADVDRYLRTHLWPWIALLLGLLAAWIS